MELKDLKFKIKAVRVGQGIKTVEFAKRVGISREYLRRIEGGTAKNISLGLMKKIAEELHCDVTTLFF